jgi:hypothetical protein
MRTSRKVPTRKFASQWRCHDHGKPGGYVPSVRSNCRQPYADQSSMARPGHLLEIAPVSRDEDCSSFQHGRADPQVHLTHLEFQPLELFALRDRRLIEVQNLKPREEAHVRGETAIGPCQFLRRFRLAELRVPSRQLLFDRHDGNGQVAWCGRLHTADDRRMSILEQLQHVRVEHVHAHNSFGSSSTF